MQYALSRYIKQIRFVSKGLNYKKKSIRIIKNTGKMESCRELFGKLKILTFYSQYIYLLLCSVCNIKGQYIHNLYIHGKNTRYGSDFHYPTSNLALYQRLMYFMGLKVFNSLPSDIMYKVYDIKEFK
jgi:hypothetical protein